MLVTRIGDLAFGICFWPPPPAGPGPLPAVGIVITGKPTILDGGLPISTIGDSVVFPCGIAMITGGSPMELSTGMPTCVLGTPVIGPLSFGSIITGNPTHLTV